MLNRTWHKHPTFEEHATRSGAREECGALTHELERVDVAILRTSVTWQMPGKYLLVAVFMVLQGTEAKARAISYECKWLRRVYLTADPR
jgi:hypothetical protein